jgi:hypothetical protein
LSSVGVDIRALARHRAVPTLAEAISATGGVAVTLGVLLITIDLRADNPGRAAETALFAALVLAGYLTLRLLPAETHAAGVSAIVLGIPGTLGWLLLPGAHRYADIRPFILLTIAAWILAFVLPRTRGRTIFIAAAAVFLWLWVLGEVAATDAYSASPIPSPPAHTIFSLESFATVRPAAVELGDLDSSDPLFALAQQCSDGEAQACDELYTEAEPGSDFQGFAATCGNSQPDTGSAGFCILAQQGGFGASPIPNLNPISPITTTGDDKSFEIGLVSTLFGVLYLGALYVLDRSGWRGLATAFVVPGVVALVTGMQSLGNASHHVWGAGLLTFIAGLFIGLIGDRTGRRFTTWAGAVAAALGGLTVALDLSHVTHALNGENVKLAGPGLIVVGFGIGLAAAGTLIAYVLGNGPSGPPPPDVPTEEPPAAWPTLPGEASPTWPPQT